MISEAPQAAAAAAQPAKRTAAAPAYPPQGQPVYPPQGQPVYPPQGQPVYPPQGQPVYPPQGQPAYPPQGQPAYPPQGQPAYPPQGQPAYPPQGQPAYPPQGQPAYPPQGQPAYPPQGQPAYPPQGQPGYPPGPVLADDGTIVEPPAAPAPEPAPESPTPKAPAEALAADSYEGKIAASPYRRPGIAFGGSLGTRFCLQTACTPEGEGINPGVNTRLFFEYRFLRYVSAGLTFGFAYHKILSAEAASPDPLTSIKQSGMGWNLLATLTAYPVPFSRFDPYVGLGFGFAQQRSRTTTVTSGSSSASQTVYNRGVLRLSFGLDIYLTSRFSLGPRLDIDRGFAGKACAEDSGTQKSCIKFPAEENDSFPRWVSAMIDFKGHF
jgi:hypothetical protein